jgi:hypothetical protein
MPLQTCFLETRPPGFAARVVHGLRFHLELASEGCNSMGVAAGFPPLAEYAFDGFGQHRGARVLAIGPTPCSTREELRGAQVKCRLTACLLTMAPLGRQSGSKLAVSWAMGQ